MRRFSRQPSLQIVQSAGLLTCVQRRSGVAELELIMVLPILIGFVFGLLWIGIAMETQGRMLVQSRRSAWSQRTTISGAPYRFSDLGLTTQSASEQVKFVPLAKYFVPAKASDSIMAGAWDYRLVDLNSPPHYNTFETVLTGAGQSGADALAGIGNVLADYEGLLRQAISRFQNASGQADQTDMLDQSKRQIVGQLLKQMGIEQARLIEKQAAMIAEAAKDLENPNKLKKKISALGDMIDSFGEAMDSLGDL